MMLLPELLYSLLRFHYLDFAVVIRARELRVLCTALTDANVALV